MMHSITFPVGHFKACSENGSSTVFNLSCKNEMLSRASDAGADVFLLSSLEGYNELLAAFKLCKHLQRQTRLVELH